MDWQSRFAGRAAELRPSAIRQTAAYAARPGVINFASGSPNPDLFPHDEAVKAAAAIMADPVRRAQALQYGPTEGYAPLREWIAARATRDGATVSAANVQMIAGSQQALELVSELFIEPGDRIIVATPAFLGALQAFNLRNPAYVSLPADDSGLDLAVLERECAMGARFIYLMPDFGNPSGVTLPLDQRRRILELSRQHGVPIIEDQAYQHLWFGKEPLPTMLALDNGAEGPTSVIHIGTFSKSIAPGLRVGWITAPKPVIEKLALIKQASDLQGPLINQMIVHDIAVEAMDRRADGLRAAYRQRCEAMLRALARHMPQNVRWNEPKGGMFVWLTLPDPIDASDLLTIAVEEKVVGVPGAPFYPEDGDRRTMRLSFSLAGAAQIEEGVERLARAIRKAMKE